MKIFILIPFLFFALNNLRAQIIEVRDSGNNNPLELVTLSSDSPKVITVTNDKGKADLSLFLNSKKIKFQLIGYEIKYLSYDEIIDNNGIIYLVPTSISLDQIVVSASKWNQSIREVPIKINILSRKEIEIQNPQTAADLLNISGEVFIQKSQQGGGSPMIRGFATNRLLISVDGVRMNNAIFRSGNLQNVISLDPFAIENTEVIFGPGSIIYGSDAIGGSMNFFTLNPQFSYSENILVKGNSALRYSSANNEYIGHLDLNFGWPKVAILSSFSYNNFGDLKMGSFGPKDYLRPEYVKVINGEDFISLNKDNKIQIPTGYSQYNFMNKLKLSLDQNWELNYGFHYSQTSNYDRYDRLIRYKNGLPRSAEWYYGPQIWMLNNFSIAHNNPNMIYDELNARISYQYFRESRIDRDFQKTLRRKRIEEVSAYSFNLDFYKEIDLANKIFYGFEAVFNDVLSKGLDQNILTGEEKKGPSRYPKSDWSSYAVYFTHQWRIHPKLLLNSGLRYNHFLLNSDFVNEFYAFPFNTAKVNDGALTGSLGFVYNPEESLSLSMNLSSGFRSPNVDDIGKIFDSEPGKVIVPNPNLSAEYAYNLEIGAAKIFNSILKFDITSYYTFLIDAMVRRDFLLNGRDSIIYDGELSKVQAIQNAANAYVWGIQTGLEIKIAKGLVFHSRFNFQEGKEELDNGDKSPLRHAGPFFGSLHLNYSIDNFSLNFNYIFNGEISFNNLAEEERGKNYLYAKDKDGNPYSPSWNTFNFKGTYRFSKSFFLTFGVENITDERYRPYSSGIAAPGRNFILALYSGF